jgi:hypothetical protein
MKDFWEYDPATNTWTQKADFGGTARYSAVGFSIADKGYLGTGTDGFHLIRRTSGNMIRQQIPGSKKRISEEGSL